jgi:5-methylthioadenosine/S-adenosylhomocysteine deaminase
MTVKTVLLKDADFLVKDSETVEKNTSVVVEGNMIAGTGKTKVLKQEFTVDQVIDLSGMILLPGLINCHTHTAETMYRGRGHDFEFPDWMNNLVYPTNMHMEDEEEDLFYALAQLTAMEAIASGTTSFIDNCVNFTKRHVLSTAQGLHDMGFRAAVAKDAVDWSPMDRGFTDPIDDELRDTERFITKWKAQDSDLVQAWVGPNGTAKKPNGGASDELLQELKKLADRHDTRFHIHLAGTHWEIANVKKQTGYTGSIAMANSLGILDDRTSLAHCIWLDEAEKQILKETGTQAVHCPSCNQICAIGVFPYVDLLELGVTCAIGTDGAPQNDSIDMFREMRSAVLLQRITRMDADAVSHKDAFRSATVEGAKVLEVEKLGKVEPGYLADLTAVRARNNMFLMPIYDPLETLIYACSGGRDVAMTMVNGEVLYSGGKFKTVDPVKVMETVQESSVRINEKILKNL